MLLGKCNPGDDFYVVIFSTKKHARGTPLHIGPNVHIYPTNSYNRWLYLFGAVRLALRLGKFDIVTTQDPFETGLVGFIISRVRKCCLHIQVHTDFLSDGFKSHNLLNRVRTLFAFRLLRKADGIQVVSCKIKEEIERLVRPKVPIGVVPVFTDISRFKDAVCPKALADRFSTFGLKFLVVARLESEKNIKQAVQSFAEVCSIYDCLIIVGDGNERRSLARLSVSLHISDRVFFEGWKDPAPYYVIADLVLTPSFYEGYSMTIVEALAVGVPVLSADVGAAREVGAVIADNDFSSSLAEWITRGPRKGNLVGYPYANIEDYITAFHTDVCRVKKNL